MRVLTLKKPISNKLDTVIPATMKIIVKYLEEGYNLLQNNSYNNWNLLLNSENPFHNFEHFLEINIVT